MAGQRESKLLGRQSIAIVIGFFLVLSAVDVFLVDDDQWFDESFSLQTVHKLNQGERIDWGQYDVHSGLYYRVLQAWVWLKPFDSLMVHHWARLLSVLCMSVFLYTVFKLVELLASTKRAVLVTYLLALSSTYIHFGNEIRAYALGMMVSAILTYCVVWISLNKSEDKFEKELMMIVCVFALSAVLPWIHYWYAMVPAFLMVAQFFVSKKGEANRIYLTYVLALGLVFGVGTVMPIALEQMSRSDGMWFQPPTLASFPSALMFAFVFVEEAFSSAWMIIPYLAFLAMFVFAMLRARHQIAGEDIRKRWLAWMLLTSLMPFFGLLLPKLFLSGGFQNVYHHRLFLGVTWMFAIAVLLAIVDGRWTRRQLWLYLGLVLLLSSLFSVYVFSEHFEVKRVAYNTPCGDVTIVHESPFSAIPFEVYARERGCDWHNVVSTNLTVRQARTAGFDGLRPEQIYYDQGSPERPWLYVRAARTVTEDGRVIYQDDGVELVYVD